MLAYTNCFQGLDSHVNHNVTLLKNLPKKLLICKIHFFTWLYNFWINQTWVNIGIWFWSCPCIYRLSLNMKVFNNSGVFILRKWRLSPLSLHAHDFIDRITVSEVMHATLSVSAYFLRTSATWRTEIAIIRKHTSEFATKIWKLSKRKKEKN